MSTALALQTQAILAGHAPVHSLYAPQPGRFDSPEGLGVYARMRHRIALQYLTLRQRAARQSVSDLAQEFRSSRRVKPDHSKLVARFKGLHLESLVKAQPLPGTVAELGDSPVVPSSYVPDELEIP